MAYCRVGRPAVREALLLLNKTGFLSVTNGDRSRVTEPDPRDLLQLLSGASKMLLSRNEGIRQFQKTWTFVELVIVREAVRLATDADVADLGELLIRNQACADDIAAFSVTDDAFHHRIASIALDALYHIVLQLLEDQRRMSPSHPDALAQAITAHRAIFEAVRDRDADRAEAAIRAHLATVVETYWDSRRQDAEDAS